MFKNKNVCFERLEPFGFVKNANGYVYTAALADGQLTLTVTVPETGDVQTRVVDTLDGEPYTLHLVPAATGAFVGRVKQEYEDILLRVAENCFEKNVFKTAAARKIIAYIQDEYGEELEFLWQKFSENAIVRRKDNAKWYAAFLTVPKSKLGLAGDEKIEILDLRMTPEEKETLIDNKKYFLGYHMNKSHWLTLVLDESVPFDEMCARVRFSRELAKNNKKTRV